MPHACSQPQWSACHCDVFCSKASLPLVAARFEERLLGSHAPEHEDDRDYRQECAAHSTDPCDPSVQLKHKREANEQGADNFHYSTDPDLTGLGARNGAAERYPMSHKRPNDQHAASNRQKVLCSHTYPVCGRNTRQVGLLRPPRLHSDDDERAPKQHHRHPLEQHGR